MASGTSWACGPGGRGRLKAWRSILAELRNRGVGDVCIVVCDGLKGLPEAITEIWPQTTVQLCVVHYADLGVMPTSRPGLLAGGVLAA